MRTNERSIVRFASISHAMVHTYELSIPILVAVWLVELPVDTAIMGLVVAVGYGLYGFGALPGGILADRVGSRNVIIGCLIGMSGSFLVLGTAQGIFGITIALCLWGLSASVYHPAGLSLISTGVKNRGTGFAYHGMAGNAGIALGPLVTALFLLVFDWRVVAVLLAIPTVIAIGYAFTRDFEEMAAVSVDGGTKEAQITSVNQFVADSKALFSIGFTFAILTVMMNGLFYRGALTFLPDVLSNNLTDVASVVPLENAASPITENFDLSSYIYAGLLVLGIGGQYVGGKLTERTSPTLGLAFVFGSLTIVAMVFIPAAESGLLALLLVAGILGFLLFTLQPLYQATIAEYSPPEDRGLSYGYTYFASFGIGAVGAAITGYLLTVVNAHEVFVALAVFPALGAVLSLTLFRAGSE